MLNLNIFFLFSLMSTLYSKSAVEIRSKTNVPRTYFFGLLSDVSDELEAVIANHGHCRIRVFDSTPWRGELLFLILE